MKKINLLLIIVFFLTPVYAQDNIKDCVLEGVGIEQCIEDYETPCFDECFKEGNLVEECKVKCMPEAECIFSCALAGEDESLCKEQCDASFEDRKCEITCLHMCENAHCSEGECEKDCEEICEKECQQTEDVQTEPAPTEPVDTQPDTGSPTEEEIEEVADVPQTQEATALPPEEETEEETQENKEEKPNDCYSVCHKFCTVPCTEDCEERECIEECYVDCSRECRNECAGAPGVDEEKGESGWTFEFWAMLGFIAVLITSIGGWRASTINRRESLKLMDKVENIFNEYKNNSEVCINKLEEIRVMVKNEFAEKKLDENTFNFLMKRIEKYMQELEKRGEQNKNNDERNNKFTGEIAQNQQENK